jgi:hypothetical protein
MSLGQGLASKYYSGFNPLIYGDCALWVDAGDTTTLTLSGSNITAVRDKSPQSNAITVSATQPTYVSNRQNGLGGIFMNGASWLINTTLSYSLANRTIFIVAEQTASSTTSFEGIIVFGGSAAVLDYNSSNAIVYSARGSNAGQNVSFSVYGRLGDYVLNFGTSTTPMPFRVYSESFAYPNGTLFVDGSQTVTDTAAQTVGTATGWVIGGRFDNNNSTPRVPLYGYIYEILVYSNTLPAIDRQAIESYLMRKWGRTANIPTTHPYSAILPVTRPFLPLDVSNCALWLDAADFQTLILSNTDVSQWTDKSGRARNFIQGTSGSRPTYISNGLNGYPTIQFASKFLSNAGFPLYASASSGMSFFAVFSTTNRNQQTAIMQQMWNGSLNFTETEIGFSYASGSGYSSNNYGSIGLHRGNGAVTETASNTINSNITYAYSAIASNTGTTPTSVGLFLNGTQYTSVDFSAGVSNGFYSSGSYPVYSSAVYLGARNDRGPINNYLAGDIAELILYNTMISPAQRQRIEGYLAAKWGLRSSLPSTHLLKNSLPATVSFNPRQISNCALWLDAVDYSTLTLSGSNVTDWLDKGPNRLSGTVFNSPVYTQNALGVFPGVTFNGTSQYISFGNVLNMGTSPIYVFSVCKYDTTGDGTIIAKASYRGNPGRWFLTRAAVDGGQLMGIDIGTSAGIPAFSDTTTNVQLFSGYWDRSAVYVLQNGTQRATTSLVSSSNLSNTDPLYVAAYPNSTGTAPNTIGGYTYLSGKIGEIIVYLGSLTAGERQQVEGYLAWKWGLQGPSSYITTTNTITNPTQLSGCAFWLDATDAASFTFSSGSNVSQWRDKTSNVYAGTGVNSPTRVANSLNGYTSVNFNGTNQYIDFGNIVNMGTSQIYIFVVSQHNSTASGAVVGKTSYRGNTGRWAMARDTTSGGMYMLIDPNGTTPAAPAFTDTSVAARILTGYWDRSNVFISENGTQRATAALASSTNLSNTDPLYVAAYPNSTGTGPQAGLYLNGKIGEVIVYLGSLTTIERQDIEGYLAIKWGLQGSLPGSHPYAIKGLPSTHPYKKISPI